MVFPPLLVTGNGRDCQEGAVSRVTEVMKDVARRGYPFHKYLKKKNGDNTCGEAGLPKVACLVIHPSLHILSTCCCAAEVN